MASSPRLRAPARTLSSLGTSIGAQSRLLDAATIAVTAAILIGTLFVRRHISTSVDADELLPIGFLALRFGRRGGLVGVFLAILFTVAWELKNGDDTVSVLGYGARLGSFTVLAVLLGTFVDQRHRTEAELLRYFDASMDMLATVDQNGRLVRVNPAWKAVLGYSLSDLGDTPLLELVHPEDRDASREVFGRLAAGGGDVVGYRNRYIDVAGNVHWLEWTARADRHNRLVHGTARDITTQVEAERQLDNNARLLEEMVAERTAELEEARSETLLCLAHAGEYRDDETFQHTERVGETAAAIALRLGLGACAAQMIREAAPLHDIGKIAVPDAILLKRGPLDDEERREMERHAEVGAKLLSDGRSPVLELAAEIALSHHERWNGSGYPRGLAGESIPLTGRIVAVADVFDALTHDRPYKRAWDVRRAIREMKAGSGEQFDPRVVDALLAVLAEDGSETQGAERRADSTRILAAST